MIVRQERPPLFAEIDLKFKVAHRRGVLYTFGNVIYNPDGVHIPAPLIAHEEVHADRQLYYIGGGVEAWWQRYLADDSFRLNEELPAHQAEYRAICQETKDRNQRARALQAIAGRLASSLYGNVIQLRDAQRLVRA